MSPHQRKTLRLAVAIHKVLHEHHSRPDTWSLPADLWATGQRLSRQMRHAQQRGWQAAYRRRRDELSLLCDRIHVAISDRQRELHARPPVLANLRTIVMDLDELRTQFVEVDWDLREATLSITTDPITLEGQYLGAFTIELDWKRLGAPGPYRVIACDPHPAERDNGVTHPHVQAEALCEGEGTPAIRAALASGRLYDFFRLVANILTTYNSHSAYVCLDDWDGSACSDCGDFQDHEDVTDCCRCEASVCYDCRVSCCVCDDSYCAECVDRCAVCEESACIACLDRCDACRSCVCTNCLNQQNLCEKCHAQKTEPEEESTIVEAACPQSMPDVHTHRLGQADLPA